MLTTINPQENKMPSPRIEGVWRASAMAIPRAATCSTGFAALDAQLPGEGWPRSALVEVLVSQPGIGEMCLLAPALAHLSSQKRRLALIQPPFVPCAAAAMAFGISPKQLMWLQPRTQADALWAAELLLKKGEFGSMVLWQNEVRGEALRRLSLAAREADSHLFLIRPAARSSEPSPAQLRISLAPTATGVEVKFLKRQGPPAAEQFELPLLALPASRHPIGVENDKASDQSVPTVATTRSHTAVLV